RRLDGLPLAIELAAARLRHLPLGAVVDRLDGSLTLLVGGPRDRPARHQTLRDAISWSYDLLTTPQQAQFHRLAVFVGGWTLEAAAAVAGADRDPGTDLLEAVSSLVDDSVVQRSPGGEGAPRFSMLETIREFAREQLARSGDQDETIGRHTAYFLALAEAASQEIEGPEQAPWLARLAADHDNLRAVFARAIDGGDADTALRLGAALWDFWAQRGYLLEGRTWLERGLALSGGDEGMRAAANYYLGNLALDLYDAAGGRDRFTRSLGLWRRLDDRDGIACALNGLGLAARDLGDYALARAHVGAALAIWSALGDEAGLAVAQFNLGTVETHEGSYEQARSSHEEALALRRRLGHLDGVAYSLRSLANVARFAGEAASATTHFRESLAMFRDLGDSQGEALALYDWARLDRQTGDDARSLARFLEAMTIFQARAEENRIVACVEGVATVAVKRGPVARAVQLLGAAAAFRREDSEVLTDTDRRDLEQALAAARRHLTAAAFAAARAAGQGLGVEQAAAEARLVADETVRAPETAEPFGLTPRERQVLALLGQRLTDKEIADRLYLSPRTVERHVGAILAKLGVANRREAAALAARPGLA
nr:tetratricopeptide repeat protein [Chloroflexia bacterium]